MCIKKYQLLNKKSDPNKKSKYRLIKDKYLSRKRKLIIIDFDLTLEDRIEIGKATIKEMFKEIA